MSPDLRQHPDAELVVLAQAGDTRAFDELVTRYQEKVYRLSYKILRHEDDAAEALQDAFLSAFRGLKNFKAESTFSTWLYRIATNAALMKYRKRRDGHVSLEQSQSGADDREPLEIPDWSAKPPEDLLNAELREVMAELGFRTFLPAAVQAPIIVTFHAPADPAYDFRTFYEKTRERGYILYPGKLTQVETFRVGCIGAIDDNEMRNVVGAVAQTLKDMGIKQVAPAPERRAA
jgi:RNA polymerase sigma factor (sigma-70 family)